MDVENQSVCPLPSESASEQKRKPVHFQIIRQRPLPVYCKHKRAILGIVISLLIFACAFGLGTLVSLTCQKDAVNCPFTWIGYRGHCYNLSREEKNWKESQNVCISHSASLAKITDEEEKAFVRKLAEHHVFWIGLKREPDQPWKWLDGEDSRLDVMGNGGNCAFLNDATASSGRCTTEHRYICKKN